MITIFYIRGIKMNALLVSLYGLIFLLIIIYLLSLFIKIIENDIYNEMKSLGKITSKKLDNYSEEFPNKKYIKLTNEI